MKKSVSKKKKWVKIAIITFVVLVILSVGILGYSKIRANRNNIIFQQGLQIGYTQAVLQIMNLSLSCKPVPVYAGNASVELINVGCLG